MGVRPDRNEARRRLVALLLARGEIGSPQPRGAAVDEPPQPSVAVDGEAKASRRFQRGETADRAA